MRTFNTLSKGYKALLLVSCVSAFAAATPAYAQVDCDANPDDPSCAEGDEQIVVTGSRILRQDYQANSPMITVDEDFLKDSSTAAIEQQLNKLPQFVVSQSSTIKNSEGTLTFAGGDIQPNATNTPGAATISLRGVGANRSLVLVDGRRGVPGNASGTVDVSTLPSAAIERVEIITGGASATYGADAVAGVTNFILKKDFQGLELDGQVGFDQRGNGLEYQLSGIMGSDFDDGRGNVMLAMSWNKRESMLQADNPWFRDIWENPDTTAGGFFFTPRPGIQAVATAVNASTFFPGADPSTVNCQFFCHYYTNEDGSIFMPSTIYGSNYAVRGAGSDYLQEWDTLDSTFGTVWKETSTGTLYAINGLTPQTIPTTRYNMLARGNYEINDWIGVFAQGSFSHVSTYTVQEPGPIFAGWGINMPWGNGTYTGNGSVMSSVLADGVTTNPAFQAAYPYLNCAGYTSGVGGCTNTEAFQQVVPDALEEVLNARFDPNASASLTGYLPLPRETFSNVLVYNMIAGLEGSIPDTDWTWEAYVNHGVSETTSRQTGMYSIERTRTLFTAPNFGQGFSATGNAQGGGFGASTATCDTGLNFFGGYDGASEDCFEAISADVSNKSTTRQTIAEANFQGKLIDLPAGELRAALGASYREERYEFINETLTTAGRSFLDQVIGIYPSMNMEEQGYDTKELYGELLVPLLHDLPLIQQFDLELGGRMSHYSTTGTSYTFKVLGDWQVTDWLRIRGGFNRAERAPNIAELLLTPQQAFRSDPTGDVCSTRHNLPGSANSAVNPDALDVQAICLELMARDNNGAYVDVSNPDGYYAVGQETTRQPTGAGAGFAYAVGNQYYRENIGDAPALTPEVADTWTLGAVISSPIDSGLLSRLTLTVDYFNIVINDPIGEIGAGGVLLRCVSSLYNPAAAGVADGATSAADLNDPAIRARAQAAIAQSTCPDVYRDTTAVNGTFGGLNSARVYSTYDNDGQVKLSGLDATLNWSTPVGPGTLFLNLNGSYMFDFKVQNIDGAQMLDYVGTLGTGSKGVNYGSSYEYRIFGSLGYSWNDLTATLQWQHNSAVEDSGDVGYYNGLTDTKNNITGTPAYDLFNFNASYQVTDNVRLRLGIDNLFNRKPHIVGAITNANAATGQVSGGSYSYFEDQQGRRISLGANLKF